ncbi:MAG TPA: aryl-sulfate sulfotransferase [Bacteroidia bacterium]|nr:aryl-sulfate sulfotransferase [Bacteroidia bacterium]
MIRKIEVVATILITSFMGGTTNAQQSVGLFLNTPESFNGYTLFAPISSDTTFLIDNCGKSVHQWVSSYKPGLGAYLQEDGILLRGGRTNGPYFNGGGKGGELERRDWQGNLLWNYYITDSTQCLHHDFKPLPNGNILAIVWEKKSTAEAVAAGRNPQYAQNGVWSEKIVELAPSGTNGAAIVWEWHAWDHLVQDYNGTLPNYYTVSDHPELIDVNFAATSQSDWLHMNAIAYNPALDQIILSVHQFGEIWVIDHSTTTSEAASHSGGNAGAGGDLLYRWGNPFAYQRGTVFDQKLFGQHDVQWIADSLPHGGSIMCFNNGFGRPAGNYSTIEIIQPPLLPGGGYQLTAGQPYGPQVTELTWPSQPDTSFFGANISGVQMQANGNLLICEGPSGTFFEIDSTGTQVWKYINPVSAVGVLNQGTTPVQNTVFKIQRYAPGYSGLSGVTLTPGLPIELNPLPYVCAITTDVMQVGAEHSMVLFPVPVQSTLNIALPEPDTFILLTVVNASGATVFEKRLQKGQTQTTIDFSDFAAGLYSVVAKGTTTVHSHVIKLP